ncbi:GntR family transcriptional regulator [Amycolatopsis acidicola]|uniref:GntR family transcriptional regulator n=1 Tax=Amycolatopsis acidicola TaxID=2596893 RepID=A0A5N0UZ34_9PSEU|nr:GntR family transcriptional regulator [Amycolatopsis acidicola]KAA9159046.1 GntR family transcriptional regulator [Amycolatopsis acidicola]
MSPAENANFVPRASLADTVYERLREEIMHGQIADGSRLNQVDLAARYGVSRIPIREALRRLQAESLVIATPYHPYVVRNVTADQVLELVDIRAVLEDLALAKRKELGPGTVAELRRINREMASGPGGEAFLALDRQFHTLIAGPDSMVVGMINDVRDKVHKYVSNMVDAKPGRTAATQEHEKIISALEAQDMDFARRLMREHVMQSRLFIMNRLAVENTEPPEDEKPKPAKAGRKAKSSR